VNAAIRQAQGCVVAFVTTVVDGRGIDMYVPFGTGFFLNAEGFLATNAHVVDAATKYRASGSPVSLRISTRVAGQPFKGVRLHPKAWVLTGVEEVAVDKRSDVAIVRATGVLQTIPRFLSLLNEDAEPGTKIAFTGFALAQDEPITFSGHVASIETTASGAHIAEMTRGVEHFLDTYFCVDVPIHGGHSGSPVFRRKNGAVIGIASGAFPTPVFDETRSEVGGTGAIGYVRPIKYLMRLMKSTGVSYSVHS
jgi:S1-C subfamily serine protease